jgi:hypothetical protein
LEILEFLLLWFKVTTLGVGIKKYFFFGFSNNRARNRAVLILGCDFGPKWAFFQSPLILTKIISLPSPTL